jgi:hypothetical protein
MLYLLICMYLSSQNLFLWKYTQIHKNKSKSYLQSTSRNMWSTEYYSRNELCLIRMGWIGLFYSRATRVKAKMLLNIEHVIFINLYVSIKSKSIPLMVLFNFLKFYHDKGMYSYVIWTSSGKYNSSIQITNFSSIPVLCNIFNCSWGHSGLDCVVGRLWSLLPNTIIYNMD